MTIESRYTLASALEQGRFGTMYRAASSDRADEVVVWVLPPEFTHHGPARAAFLRDLERVRELVHPNIARVLEVGQDEDRLFVVTEWTDGDTLRNVLDALGPERLELDEADTIIEDIGSALAYAHERGIVHGDVRAENVTVTSKHRIKVANFMLSSLARNTPFAPAPLDDTRALAALAHELYSGVPPSRDASAEALRELPRQRRKAIAMALTASSSRPLSVAEFLAHAHLARDGHRVKPEGRPRAAEKSGRSPWRIVLPAVGLAAVAAAALVSVDGARVPAGPTGAAQREAAAAADAAATPVPQQTAQLGEASDGADAGAQPTPTAPAEPPQIEQPAVAPAEATEAAARPRTPPAVAAVAAVAPAPAPSTQLRSRVTTQPDRLTLSGFTVTVYEDQGTARLDVVRTANLDRPLDFVWWTSDGTAHADEDYATFGARVESFAPNEAERSIFIPLASDAVAEGPESFFVHVSADRRASADKIKVTAEIHIIDDDF